MGRGGEGEDLGGVEANVQEEAASKLRAVGTKSAYEIHHTRLACKIHGHVMYSTCMCMYSGTLRASGPFTLGP